MSDRHAEDERSSDSLRHSPDRIQREVDEELRFELDMRAAELVAEGLSETEARRKALAEFGDMEHTRRYCADLDRAAERSHRRTEWLAEVRQDVRLTWRALFREPGFALVVLITLALGIGANTAVFSVLNRILIERLPYEDPDRLVRLYGGRAGVPAARTMLSAAEIAAMQQSPAFAEVAPFGNYGGLTHVDDRGAEMWSGVQVGPEFFHLLGIRPLFGRAIDARDVGPDALPVVVLSHDLWQRAFGGDTSIVGRDVRLNGQARTVVGVMPKGFISPDRDPEAWTPLDLTTLLRDPIAARQGRMYRAVGRLGEDATVARVEAGLDLVAHRLRAENIGADDVAPAHAVPLRDDMVGSIRPVLLVVMGAAALVLLLCCVNVAELFLSRATARRRELAIRAAIGAGRARIVRQLLTESAVVALIGGGIGVAFAFWLKRVFVDAMALMLPTVRDVPMDGRVLGFALAVSLLSALGFGLLPAIAGTRTDPQGALAESPRGASAGRSSMLIGRILVVAQVALAVVLLIGAGLLGRTLLTLERTGVGFDTGADMLTFRVNLSSDEYAAPADRAAFFNAYTGRLRSLPGVRAVGSIGVSPWSGYTGFGPDSVFVEGQSEATIVVEMASRVTVSEDWFGTLGIPVQRGRSFSASDDEGAPPVAIVSESVAQRYWPGADPVGRRLRIGGRNAEWLQVVGVVGDVRARPSQEVRPTVYVPMRQNPQGGVEFVVRAAANGLALVPAIRRELFEVDPNLPVGPPRTLNEIFDGMLAGQRLPLLFTGAFAMLALVLAVLGVYSVMAYSVTARRREFGIRVALGAPQASVLALVLRQGMAMAVAGTAAGVLVAGVATRSLEGLLVGVTPHDAATFTAVPLILLVVSCAACLIPARRSVGIEPVEALRVDQSG